VDTQTEKIEVLFLNIHNKISILILEAFSLAFLRELSAKRVGCA
jgi:hypothetical protein